MPHEPREDRDHDDRRPVEQRRGTYAGGRASVACDQEPEEEDDAQQDQSDHQHPV